MIASPVILSKPNKGSIIWPPPVRQSYDLLPGSYNKVLPYIPPSKPDISYFRGDAWAVTIPGLPFVPQGSSEHPERCLTGFYNRWDASWRQKIRAAHGQRGYTHILLWLADMLCGPMNVSLSEVAYLCAELKAAGFYVAGWLGSKEYPQFIPHDAHVNDWRTALDPVFDELKGLLDIAVIGGEYDLWNLGNPNDPTPFEIADYVVSKGLPTYFHFSTYVTFWGNIPGTYAGHTINDRFDWYRVMCDIGVQGNHYQGNTEDTPENNQGRIADTLGRCDSRWHIVAAEVLANAQFTQDHPDELDGCRMGYIDNMTLPLSGDMTQYVHGYFNGGYRPDGSGL